MTGFKSALILILLLSSAAILAQRPLKATLVINGETKHVSYLNRKGIPFVSAKELSLALGGYYFYNDETKKLEMKFSGYKIKVTAITQYIILIDRSTNEQTIFQIPISTLSVKNDVYLPISYSLQYIGKAFGNEILYDNGEKNFSVTTNESQVIVNNNPVKPPAKENPKVTKRPAANSPYDIYGISIEEKTNGTLIRLKTQRPIHKFSSSIKEGILYLFTSKVTVDASLFNALKTTGLVRSAKVKSVKGNYQFEFRLREGYSTSEAFQDPDNYDLILTIHNKTLETPEKNIEDINKWLFDVIVIDAGHGGKDPGAIGVTKVKEKDVNLGISLKLGKLIEKEMKDVKVVYTRKDDRFIELYKRGKIANEANGKLFISIHCNSLAKKPSSTRGYEVYLLRPGRTKEAIDIAEFENSVIRFEENPEIYQKLTDENFILVSMAHSAYMRYSEKFADELNQEYGNTSIPSRGVKQAGFYVLVGASMPGVLVETGFLSNRNDEKYLKSSSGQQKIAKSIFDAIKSYREYYEKIIEDES